MLAGYELKEVLAGDELYTLRRGVAAVDGAAVLIKTPTRAVPGSAEIACLRREFVLLQSLQIGAVARARALAHDGRSVALVYEGFAGVPLAALVEAKAGDVAFVLQVALQLATVLESLHGRGIAHNALNPSAILVDAASGGVQLVDFSAAAEEAAVVHGGLPQQPLRSRLAYASPEQTARTTRVADYRSDFYSLGVVMYQLLTGLLPFKSDDPLELIHWHIAKIPAAPCELQPRVPRPVSEIAMKLLAKTPEERYQSAAGLRADLERCAREWAHQGRIAPFAIARNDLSERFVVPQQLYGREQELETLIAAFEHSCDGPPVMALVAGYAGIGKTALIGELSGPIARRRGYFVTGKFDQVTRDVPHQALIQALRQLVQRLLTEDAARMERWRLRLSRALGDNAGVVAAVLPEIEGVIGETAPPLPLPPTEARNRFASAFQNLIAALASAEQPLAILLDDLQWADAATLSLLHPLLERLDVPGLMLIGAYRDNEVDAEHPLTRAIAELDQAGVALCRIALGPLGTPDLVQMIAQCLHCDPAAAEPLAAVLQSKTAGNPFFVIQFLKTLHQERLIQFSPQARCWSYRLEAVRRADITDNVIDLMARKIGRLSPRTQHVLRRAACVGNRFDLATLATVSEQSAEALAADLTEALSQGLVLPARGERSGDRSGAAFAFLHDRVQQAAYGQIPAEQRPRVHLSVGRLLLRRWRQLPGEESVFDIVGHLNAGSALITEDAERIELARLNLEAAHEAKSATAFETALGYAEAGAGLLREAHWSSEYELAFSLALETAECEYLCGRFDAAERHFDALLERARTPLDQAKVYSLRLLQYESLSRYVEAIRVGHEALQRLGLSVPGTREQREAALAVEVAAIREWVSGRDLAGLAASRSMQDPALRMVMRLLTNLHTSCYLSGDKTLTMLNTAYMVRRSLEHGNTEESAYAYVLYAAMLLVPSERDYLTAHAFGELALRVNDRLPAPAIRAKVLMNIGWAISLWRRPMAESIAISREAHRLGNDNGMLVEAAYALFNECWLMLLSGGDLDAFHQACAPSVDYARRVKMRHYAAAPQLILQWGLALQGLTREPVSLSDAGFDEEAFVQAYRGQPLFEMFYFVAKLALLYTFEPRPSFRTFPAPSGTSRPRTTGRSPCARSTRSSPPRSARRRSPRSPASSRDSSSGRRTARRTSAITSCSSAPKSPGLVARTPAPSGCTRRRSPRPRSARASRRWRTSSTPGSGWIEATTRSRACTGARRARSIAPGVLRQRRAASSSATACSRTRTAPWRPRGAKRTARNDRWRKRWISQPSSRPPAPSAPR
jgi:predicted ATPase